MSYYALSFEPGDVEEPLTAEDIAAIAASDMVAIDTETTGLDYDSRILGISVAWRVPGAMHSAYLNLSHPLSLFSARIDDDIVADVMRAVFEPDRPVALLNAVFDIEKLSRWGHLELPIEYPYLYDAQILARWLMSFEKFQGVSMEKLVSRRLGGMPPWMSSMKKMRSKLGTLPAEKVSPYARADAEFTLMLVEDLMREGRLLYDDEVLDTMLERESRFLWLLTRIQRHGILLDLEEIHERSVRMTADMQELRAFLKQNGIHNPDSRDSVLKGLPMHIVAGLPQTDNGNYKIDSAALAGKGPVAEAVLRYRSLGKAVGTWLDGFRSKVASDGRLHPRFRAAGTVSGRLSCNEPNLQAVPLADRGAAFGSLMGIFKAAPGFSLLAADYEQAELRTCAAYAKSTAMANAFKNGEDIHSFAASLMWPDSEINYELRQLGKRCNYCTTYGGGYRALAENTGIPESEAKIVINTYRRAFPELVAAQNRAGDVWEQRGYITMWNGRRHYKSPNDGSYKAFNQVMQGDVAELVKDAMLSVDARFADMGVGNIVLQIHDSIEVEVQTDAVEDVKAMMRKEMVAAAPLHIMNRTEPPITMDVGFENWYPEEDE